MPRKPRSERSSSVGGVWRAAVCGLAAALLSGCYEIPSRVPAIAPASAESSSEGAAAKALPPPAPPGRYCRARVSDHASGGAVALGECLTARLEAGELVIERPNAAPERFALARLTRGAWLLQQRTRDGGYLLRVAMIRPNGVALTPAPGVTASALYNDGSAVLSLPPGAEARLRADGSPEPFTVEAGAPEAVLGRLRSIVGLWFDRALRERDLGERLVREAVFYVRADAAAPPPREIVDALREAVFRAMTLE